MYQQRFSLIFLRCLLIVCINLVGISVGVEFMLRFIPNDFVRADFYDYHPQIGHWYQKDANIKVNRSCFKTEVSTNSFGMRDRARSQTKSGLRIALLGDSMTAGLEVNDDETFSRVLEQELAAVEGSVEILNFGRDGSGPRTYNRIFDTLAHTFNPDITVMAVYIGNDISNALYEQTASKFSFFGRLRSLYIVRAATPLKYRIITWFMPKQDIHASQQNGQTVTYYDHLFIFSPKLSAQGSYKASWDEFEFQLGRFVELCKARHSRPAIVILPAVVNFLSDKEFAHNYQGLLRREFDFEYPFERIENFAAERHVPVFSLLHYMMRVKTHSNLMLPYFSHSCDGHWNKFGHATAAQGLKGFMLELLQQIRKESSVAHF